MTAPNIYRDSTETSGIDSAFRLPAPPFAGRPGEASQWIQIVLGDRILNVPQKFCLTRQARRDGYAFASDLKTNELYVFSSVVSEEIPQDSDLDFLVVFNRSGFEGAFDQYMGFKERLEKIYARPVDLYHLKKFRNPLFEEEVEKS